MHTRGESSALLSGYAVSPLSVGTSAPLASSAYTLPQPSSPSYAPPHYGQQISAGSTLDAVPSPTGLASSSLTTASPWHWEVERPGMAFEHTGNGVSKSTPMLSSLPASPKVVAPAIGSPLSAQKRHMATFQEGAMNLSQSPAIPLTLQYSSPGATTGDLRPLHMSEALNNSTSSSREVSYHFAMVKARRIVTFFKRQLQAVLESSERFSADAMVLQRVRDLADALDAEVGSAASAVGADEADLGILQEFVSTPLARSSSVANSLSAPVHRSTGVGTEVLSAELKQQARANEELLVALNAMKDTNRELKEQVRQQSDEIASLTRFRKVDAERMEDLEKTHRLEDSLREKDFKRRLKAAEEATDSRCQEVRRAYQQKLREQCSRLDQVRRDCGQLRVDHASQKRATQALKEALQQNCSKIEKEIVARVETFAKRQFQLLAMSDSVASRRTEELEVSLAEERDLRLSEASSWSHRHALLSAERDDLQARLISDLGHLDAQWRAVESRLEAERADWAQERTALLEEYGGEKQRCADGEATLRRVRSDSVERETAQECAHQSQLSVATKSLEEERQTRLELAAEFAELQRRLLSMEGELAVATTARESLREQLENQRRDLVEAGERAVQVCREDYEKQLVSLGEDSKTTETSLNQSLQAAEKRAREVEEEVKQTRAQAAAASELATTSREEMDIAKTEAAHASGASNLCKEELANIRQELADERKNFKARVEQLESEKAGLLEDTRNLQQQIGESVRAQVGTDTRCAQLAEALEAGLRERDLQIEACEQRCVGAREAAADATAEAKYQSQRIVDIQTALNRSETDSASQKHAWNEERRRLEEAIESEAAALWQNQEQYTHWRESHLGSLQQTQSLLKTFSEAQMQAITKSQEENLLQSASRERDRQLCKAELASSAQKVAELEAQLGVVEHEGSSVRNLLNESQSSLSIAQLERQNDEKQAAWLQQRLKEATIAAENASKTEVALAHELDEVATSHREERVRLEKELSEMKQHDADQAIAKERLQAGFEARIHALEARQKTELQLEKLGVESVLRENEQLRRTIASQRQQATSGADSLQAQLETHIAQLQKQTNELCNESRPLAFGKAHSHTPSPHKSPSRMISPGFGTPMLHAGAFSPLSMGP